MHPFRFFRYFLIVFMVLIPIYTLMKIAEEFNMKDTAVFAVLNFIWSK